MSTYIIAGGAGFIGSHLATKLLDLGDRVITIDNLITGSEKNIEKYFGNKNFSFINHDIVTGIPHVDGEVDGIYHLASPASPNAKSPKSYIAYPIETLMVNSVGTKNILDFAKSKKTKVVYASSSEVYGDPDRSPQKEEYFGNVNPNGPRSMYDEGKRFGEAICAVYARSFAVDTRTIRIFNTYGDGMQRDDGRVVSNFIVQALSGDPITIYGDGDQTRSFCFVDDLVEGLVSVMQRPGLKGEVFNLGNPEEYKISELAKKILELTDSSSKIIHEGLPTDDPRKRKPDISKAQEAFGFEPKINLEEGLKRTVAYFRGL